MSREGRMDALFERMNDQRIYINHLALERIAWRAGAMAESYRVDALLEEGEAVEDPPVKEIQDMALGLLLADAELNIRDLGRKIDELEDDKHKKVLKLLFNMVK